MAQWPTFKAGGANTLDGALKVALSGGNKEETIPLCSGQMLAIKLRVPRDGVTQALQGDQSTEVVCSNVLPLHQQMQLPVGPQKKTSGISSPWLVALASRCDLALYQEHDL